MNAIEAAEFLRISTYTLLEMVRKGIVPGTKLGGEWRFTDESLEDYMRKLVAGNSRETAGAETDQFKPQRRRLRPPPSLMV